MSHEYGTAELFKSRVSDEFGSAFCMEFNFGRKQYTVGDNRSWKA